MARFDTEHFQMGKNWHGRHLPYGRNFSGVDHFVATHSINGIGTQLHLRFSSSKWSILIGQLYSLQDKMEKIFARTEGICLD